MELFRILVVSVISLNPMAKRKTTSHRYSARKVNTREIKQRFLIVCEGEKTEPYYFKSFRVPTVTIDIEGLGFNPSKLVDRATELAKQEEYDQIWCVFDRNSWEIQDFKNAIAKAEQKKVKIAYSNEAFELWYILHFEFLNTGISRSSYCDKLTELLECKYQKNSETIYDDLLKRQATAIRNAEKLLAQYNLVDPANNNPSTTVHLLVKQLNQFVKT